MSLMCLNRKTKYLILQFLKKIHISNYNNMSNSDDANYYNINITNLVNCDLFNFI